MPTNVFTGRARHDRALDCNHEYLIDICQDRHRTRQCPGSFGTAIPGQEYLSANSCRNLVAYNQKWTTAVKHYGFGGRLPIDS